MQQEAKAKMMLGTRRPHLAIIADMLTVAKKPSIQNRIISTCRLSTLQWNEIISDLINKGLITTQQALGSNAKSTTAYLTTDKGRQFLEQYNILLTLLEGDDNG